MENEEEGAISNSDMVVFEPSYQREIHRATMDPSRVVETTVRVVNQTTREVMTRQVTALRGGMFRLPDSAIPEGATRFEAARLDLEASVVEPTDRERQEFEEYLPGVQRTLQQRLDRNRMEAASAYREAASGGTRPNLRAMQLSVPLPYTAIEQRGAELTRETDPMNSIKDSEAYKEKVRELGESKVVRNLFIRLHPFLVNNIHDEASKEKGRMWDKAITLYALKDLVAQCSMSFHAITSGTGEDAGVDRIIFYGDYSDVFAAAQCMGDLVLVLVVTAKKVNLDWTKTTSPDIRSSIEGLPLTNVFMKDRDEMNNDRYILYIIKFYEYRIVTRNFADSSTRQRLTEH